MLSMWHGPVATWHRAQHRAPYVLWPLSAYWGKAVGKSWWQESWEGADFTVWSTEHAAFSAHVPRGDEKPVASAEFGLGVVQEGDRLLSKRSCMRCDKL